MYMHFPSITLKIGSTIFMVSLYMYISVLYDLLMLGSDHLTSGGGGGGFEKNILALIFVKQNILASTPKKIV